MILFKMAIRNLMKQKRRSFFTAFSMIIGFVLLSITLGLIEGSYGNIIKSFTKAKTGHIQIHQKEYLDKPGLYKNFVWNEKLQKTIRSVESVEKVAPRLFSGALAFVDIKTTAAMVKGIDVKAEAALTDLDKKVEKGTYFKEDNSGELKYEALITNSLSEALKLEVGGEIVLISSGADGSIANDKFKVIGILSKGMDSLENRTVFLPLKTAQEFISIGDKVHETAIIIKDYRVSIEEASKINKVLFSSGTMDLSSEPWEVVEEQFYTSMVADKEGGFIVIFIVMLIVGVGVLNTVLMSILERMREYGVMKAMGTSPSFIFTSIVLETFFLSVFSSVAGFFLSLLAIWPLKTIGITYPEPISIGGIFMDKMNSEFVPEAFYVPVIVVIVASVLASIIPAYKAAVADPVKSMRSY